MGRGGAVRRPVLGHPVLKAVVAGLLAGLLAGCAGALHWQESRHTVREGETLYGIAWRHGLDYRKVARWNDLDDPSLIYPGQTLRLTPPEGASGRARERSGSGAAGGGRTAASEPSGAAVAAAKEIDWRWPARGEVVTAFGEGQKSTSKGIDIAGRAGDAIAAAAPGRVVYSGSGLIGYGQLIIVKHTDDHLSAYAHNRKAYVAEGDRVTAGETIAEMGRSDDGRPLLHFEIRVEGSPVDPLSLLPRE